MKFYIRLGEKLYGPFSPEQINKLGNSGKIDQNTPLCLEAHGKPDKKWLSAFVHGFVFQSQKPSNQSAAAPTTAARKVSNPERPSAAPMANTPSKSTDYSHQALDSGQKHASTEDVSDAQWYYVDSANQQNGPHSFDTIKQLLSSRVLDPEMLVWCDGMDNWVAVKNVDAFNVKANTLPPPLPQKVSEKPQQHQRFVREKNKFHRLNMEDKYNRRRLHQSPVTRLVA